MDSPDGSGDLHVLIGYIDRDSGRDRDSNRDRDSDVPCYYLSSSSSLFCPSS